MNMLFTFVIGQCFVTMLCTMEWGVFLFFAGQSPFPVLSYALWQSCKADCSRALHSTYKSALSHCVLDQHATHLILGSRSLELMLCLWLVAKGHSLGDMLSLLG